MVVFGVKVKDLTAAERNRLKHLIGTVGYGTSFLIQQIIDNATARGSKRKARRPSRQAATARTVAARI